MRRELDRKRSCVIDAVVDCRSELVARALVDEIAPGIHLIYPLILDEARSRHSLWCADIRALKALCTPWPIVNLSEAKDELTIWATWKKRSLSRETLHTDGREGARYRQSERQSEAMKSDQRHHFPQA